MGKELKPRTAAGYDADVTHACERTLLTLLSAFSRRPSASLPDSRGATRCANACGYV